MSMRSKRFLMTILASSVMCLMNLPVMASSVSEISNLDNGLVLTIGNEEGQVGYFIDETDFNLGPQDFVVEGDTIYILDAINNRINLYTNNEYCESVYLDNCISALRFFVEDEGIFVVDSNNQILQYTKTGEEIQVYSIPESIWACMVTDLEILDSKMYIQTDYQETYCIGEVEVEENVATYVSEYEASDFITLNFAKSDSAGFVIEDSYSDEHGLDLDNSNKYVSAIGDDSSGNTYLLVKEYVELNGKIALETSIQKYSSNGEELGYAIINQDDWVIYPSKYVFVTEEGKVYLLSCKSDKTTVSEVVLGTSDKSKLSEMVESLSVMSDMESDDSIIEPASFSTIGLTRSQVRARADNMATLKWTVTSANKTSRANVTLPSYVANASVGTRLTGIPYCWGGFNGYDGSNSFANLVSGNYTAGNVNISIPGYIGGTIGVDCSGYVSSAYGLSSKESTSTLAVSGRQINYSDLQQMDYLVSAGNHVVLYYYGPGTTYYHVYHAGTSAGKVTVSGYDVSYFVNNGYVARTPW